MFEHSSQHFIRAAVTTWGGLETEWTSWLLMFFHRRWSWVGCPLTLSWDSGRFLLHLLVSYKQFCFNWMWPPGLRGATDCGWLTEEETPFMELSIHAEWDFLVVCCLVAWSHSASVSNLSCMHVRNTRKLTGSPSWTSVGKHFGLWSVLCSMKRKMFACISLGNVFPQETVGILSSWKKIHCRELKNNNKNW